MIQTEIYKIRTDGVTLRRTYSDNNHYIRKVGTEEVYVEAVDVEGASYIYEETDVVIENIEEPTIPVHDAVAGAEGVMEGA